MLDNLCRIVYVRCMENKTAAKKEGSWEDLQDIWLWGCDKSDSENPTSCSWWIPETPEADEERSESYV